MDEIQEFLGAMIIAYVIILIILLPIIYLFSLHEQNVTGEAPITFKEFVIEVGVALLSKVVIWGGAIGISLWLYNKKNGQQGE